MNIRKYRYQPVGKGNQPRQTRSKGPAKRIRDKIAASKRKGMWMGGNVPLGYDVKDRKLIVNEPEASTVRLIFKRYAELGSVALLKDMRMVGERRSPGVPQSDQV